MNGQATIGRASTDADRGLIAAATAAIADLLPAATVWTPDPAGAADG